MEQINPFDKPEPGKVPEMQQLYNFEFVILDNKNFEYKDDEGVQQIESTKGRRVWKRINKSLSAAGTNARASWLYKLLVAIEGKEIPQNNLSALDVRTLIGQQLMVMLEEKGEWNNILAFAHADKQLDSVPNAAERAASEQNPKSSDEFIKGLEEDQKKEAEAKTPATADEIAETFK